VEEKKVKFSVRKIPTNKYEKKVVGKSHGGIPCGESYY
jgi:hypothetical protein